MNPERRIAKKRLAYVKPHGNGYLGRYLADGRYRNGPVFTNREEAHFWALRKWEELDRRSDDVRWLAPSKPRTEPVCETIPLYDEAHPPPTTPGPAIIRRTKACGIDTPKPIEVPKEAATSSMEALLTLDSFVHDFVGSLHGTATDEPVDETISAHAERFVRLLTHAPASKGHVLGPPVFFGASPDIGLESALSLLGSLRKTGILRVQADDVLFTISIVNGDVVHGVSYPRPEQELLGNLLVARGTIDAAQLDRFFEDCGSSASRIGQALNQQALVSTSELQAALEHQLRLLFDRLLATAESVWCFHEGEATLAYINMRLNIIGVLLDSARKNDEKRGLST